MKKERRPVPEPQETLTRMEYREILMARMAGGDLYAMEAYLKFREVDIKFDKLRVKPIYKGIVFS